jgi:hypothetical protein
VAGRVDQQTGHLERVAAPRLPLGEGAGGTASDRNGKPRRGEVGPFDVAEPGAAGCAGGLDFGSLRVPLPSRAQLQVEEGAGQLLRAVHVLVPTGRVSLSALAAPRSGPLWRDLAEEIAESLAKDGARVRSEWGDWGREVQAGSRGALSRFIGVDGPRWMLYGVATGPAEGADELAETLREMIRHTVVTRGADPLPVKTVLPLRLPEDLEDSVVQARERGPQVSDVAGDAAGPVAQPEAPPTPVRQVDAPPSATTPTGISAVPPPAAADGAQPAPSLGGYRSSAPPGAGEPAPALGGYPPAAPPGGYPPAPPPDGHQPVPSLGGPPPTHAPPTQAQPPYAQPPYAQPPYAPPTQAQPPYAPPGGGTAPGSPYPGAAAADAGSPGWSQDQVSRSIGIRRVDLTTPVTPAPLAGWPAEAPRAAPPPHPPPLNPPSAAVTPPGWSDARPSELSPSLPSNLPPGGGLAPTDPVPGPPDPRRGPMPPVPVSSTTDTGTFHPGVDSTWSLARPVVSADQVAEQPAWAQLSEAPAFWPTPPRPEDTGPGAGRYPGPVSPAWSDDPGFGTGSAGHGPGVWRPDAGRDHRPPGRPDRPAGPPRFSYGPPDHAPGGPGRAPGADRQSPGVPGRSPGSPGRAPGHRPPPPHPPRFSYGGPGGIPERPADRRPRSPEDTDSFEILGGPTALDDALTRDSAVTQDRIPRVRRPGRHRRPD